MLIESARPGDEHLAGKLYNMNIGRCWHRDPGLTTSMSVRFPSILTSTVRGTLAGPQHRVLRGETTKIKPLSYLTLPSDYSEEIIGTLNQPPRSPNSSNQPTDLEAKFLNKFRNFLNGYFPESF